MEPKNAEFAIAELVYSEVKLLKVTSHLAQQYSLLQHKPHYNSLTPSLPHSLTHPHIALHSKMYCIHLDCTPFFYALDSSIWGIDLLYTPSEFCLFFPYRYLFFLGVRNVRFFCDSCEKRMSLSRH